MCVSECGGCRTRVEPQEARVGSNVQSEVRLVKGGVGGGEIVTQLLRPLDVTQHIWIWGDNHEMIACITAHEHRDACSYLLHVHL